MKCRSLSGNAYISMRLREDDRDRGRVWGRAQIRTRVPDRCEHIETICVDCAETWSWDYIIFWSATNAGRAMEAAIGPDNIRNWERDLQNEMLARVDHQMMGWI